VATNTGRKSGTGPTCETAVAPDPIGGALFVLVLSVEGALPEGVAPLLVTIAERTVSRPAVVVFVRSVTGGALVALLSFLLLATEAVGERMTLAYVVGVLLALGPFDHVTVTVLHALFGVFIGDEAGLRPLVMTTVIATAGNVVGGLGLVTVTHVGQAMGARQSSD